MSEVINRRELFALKTIKQIFGLVLQPVGETEHLKHSMENYFKSVESSYPLLQEMPWEMLIYEANALGIPVEGRSKLDVARDVFMRQVK